VAGTELRHPAICHFDLIDTEHGRVIEWAADGQARELDPV
jgi:hypothetical protein